MQGWNILIVTIDAVYTALWMPTAVALELPNGLSSTSGIVDVVVGIILCMDILIRFHAPIILKTPFSTLTLKDPRLIARFYIRRDSFGFDVLAGLPLLLVSYFLSNEENLFIARLLRSLRLIRVCRVLHTVFQLGILSASRASSLLVTVGGLAATTYVGMVVVNLLACCWYWAGSEGFPEAGWFTETYSALFYAWLSVAHVIPAEVSYCSI
jgi:hypothetical protein